MKKILIVAMCFFVANTFSQKMITRTGTVKFEASMPAFEEIAGANSTVSCILDETTTDFVALVLIKGFKFKSPLMEEHFNENYMESSKFPKATFSGKIANFDAAKLSAKKTDFDLEGDLTIHGVTKKVKTKLSLVLTAGKITATSGIVVKAKDYAIEIPSLVKGKISEDIKIDMTFLLEPK